MAINCVEEPWEGEAEYGSQEEQSNNHFLLHRCYKGHVWPEHVEYSQTQEEHTSWKNIRQKGVKFVHTESFSFKNHDFNIQECKAGELHDIQQHTCRVKFFHTSVMHSNYICLKLKPYRLAWTLQWFSLTLQDAWQLVVRSQTTKKVCCRIRMLQFEEILSLQSSLQAENHSYKLQLKCVLVARRISVNTYTIGNKEHLLVIF